MIVATVAEIEIKVALLFVKLHVVSLVSVYDTAPPVTNQKAHYMGEGCIGEGRMKAHSINQWARKKNIC